MPQRQQMEGKIARRGLHFIKYDTEKKPEGYACLSPGNLYAPAGDAAGKSTAAFLPREGRQP